MASPQPFGASYRRWDVCMYLRRHGNPGQVYLPVRANSEHHHKLLSLSHELRLRQSEGFPQGLVDGKVFYVNFLISSYSTNTKAPPMPLSTLDQAPLKKALGPSSLRIFAQQSIVPLYMMSAVEGNTWQGEA